VQWTFSGGHQGLRNSEPLHTTPISPNSKPPPNYVAGLGRGAKGFTTRSDIGPARAAPDLPDRSAATVGGPPEQGRGHGKPDEDDDVGDDAEDKGYNENQKFDEFEGNNVGLFASTEYDEDDKEADAVWEVIDKRRREAKLKEEIALVSNSGHRSDHHRQRKRHSAIVETQSVVRFGVRTNRRGSERLSHRFEEHENHEQRRDFERLDQVGSFWREICREMETIEPSTRTRGVFR
jgi:hypothetical protein